MRGYASWKDDKLLLDGEVGNHEPGVEAIGQVVILGMVGFNALYSWILTTFFGRQLKTDITYYNNVCSMSINTHKALSRWMLDVAFPNSDNHQ